MQAVGIIGEYNPFHKGHLYHINEIKKKYPNDIIVLVLNGLFMERGEISVLTKEDKIKIALQYGVDLVVALPTLYGCQAADVFATASLKILDSLHVETVIFGSESNDIFKLYEYAKKQLDSSFQIKDNLKQGFNYPKSLALSLNSKIIPPNDLLGISYCKAILQNNLSIKLETIQRTNDYKDIDANDEIISASNIRKKHIEQKDISFYTVKEVVSNILPNKDDNLFTFLKYRIITDPNLDKYLDVTEGIENRLKKEIINSNDYNDFINKIQSKRYTKNRIQRMFIHILLGITKDNAKEELTYIKILGYNEKGQKYLKEQRNILKLPILVDKSSLQYEIEKRACLVYDMIYNTKTWEFEKTNKPIYKPTVNFVSESNQK